MAQVIMMWKIQPRLLLIRNIDYFSCRKHFSINLLLCILCFLPGCGEPDVDPSGLILINTHKDYPVSELKLNDVAEVKYIPLQSGKDSILYVAPPGLGIFVFRDTLFVRNTSVSSPLDQIILYNLSGTPLLKIDKAGRGPGEYMKPDNYTVDTVTREISIWDNLLKKVIVYDFKGNFKREYRLNSSFRIVMDLGPDHVIGYNKMSQFVSRLDNKLRSTGKRTITVMEKQDPERTAASPVFDYSRPMRSRPMIIVNHLTATAKGVYITNERSDTIYFMDRNFQLVPKMIDITPYSSKQTQVMPAIETDRYIFFSNEPDAFAEEGYKDVKFFVYDKETRKISRLNSRSRKDKSSSMPLINNEIALRQWHLTRNPDYAATFLYPTELKANYTRLPAELRQITDTLKDEDNPVLMLIKFR